MRKNMQPSYFMKQMANLLHAPIYICQKKTKEIQAIDMIAEGWDIWNQNEELLAYALSAGNKEYPVIAEMDNEMIYGVMEGNTGEIVLLGPVLLGALTSERKLFIEKKYKLDIGKCKMFPACPLGQFISGLLLVFSFMTGRELTITELWNKNKQTYENTQMIGKKLSQDLFWQQENVTMHKPYDQELKELESIENGDVEALKKCYEENDGGKIDIISKDILRSCKNILVGDITLASRAAIRGGVSVAKSLSVADSLIQQIESINSIPETEVFKRQIQYAFVKAVEEEKKRKRSKEKESPLVQKVKEYIFRNLHSSMKVSDIAKHFHVSADYLSHLFSTEENITLTRYILQEKVRRGQNLLKYSDYRIQEIGFYLGFSSQSHFTKRFQEITGMSPNEYRKKYGNCDKWS